MRRKVLIMKLQLCQITSQEKERFLGCKLSTVTVVILMFLSTVYQPGTSSECRLPFLGKRVDKML
jgi:hypothetical protein